ncbi:MAG TPA: anthranilate synthase family protein [Actinocrinis sp.]|jgi:phenazine biosynthesis protein phzE|uniref:anthranilate synthase family protein n=1 Tax=Actinocrinis sp. TaxID=1920516 RepID=UPI002DDDA9DE|nr:anthranilate synthase family protein [Actinocrinis sp.]HEV3171375.1 anthranilate synthase family protein [Actinocrinis sp.]
MPTHTELLDLAPPYALLRREGRDTVELLRGRMVAVERLADLPPVEREGGEQLVLVPYRQLRERGDACHDDETPLLSLLVRERVELSPADLPDAQPPAIRDGAFDIDDDSYARQVKAVLDDEIARGEGANFVLRRSFVGHCDDAAATALAAFRGLLDRERGAYWTFLIHTGDRILVGATPERHVSLHGGVAVMNPISGTLRKPPGEATPEEVLAFLADPKERDELAMVVDEELKMLAEVGGHGRVAGPFLKEMAHLAHTEYYIEARTDMDARRVLRETMFAPTATGSPIRNAFRVIQRHETGGRGYYAGVAALIGADEQGTQTMDASLLLRVAYLDPADGSLRIPVGATLVRGSDPYGEVLETHAKAAGVLRAFGVENANSGERGQHISTSTQPRSTRPKSTQPRATTGVRHAENPRVRAALAARNENLAPFWLAEHDEREFAAPELNGRSALIVDYEDAFTSMLAVVLRALGMQVARTPYAAVDGTAGYDERDGLAGFDLVVLGPGPGDPRDLSLPKMRNGRMLTHRLLAARTPFLAVCLGHQMVCAALGLELARRPEPNQGTQVPVDLFGRPERVGFYNSFCALAPRGPVPGLEFATLGAPEDREGGQRREIVAMRGPHYTGLQFHAESVLTIDGLRILRRELVRILTRPDRECSVG